MTALLSWRVAATDFATPAKPFFPAPPAPHPPGSACVHGLLSARSDLLYDYRTTWPPSQAKLTGSSGRVDFWDGAIGEAIWEFPTGPGTQEVVRGWLDGRLVLENDTRPGGGLHYFFRDHLGSTQVTADYFTGAPVCSSFFHPFGQSADSTGCDVHTRKFTSKERDTESGLDYFGARYYDSVAGRFISPDEPFVDQEASEPQSWNLYTYVRNDPMSNVDPTGGSCVDSKGNTVPDEKGNGAIGDNGDGRGCSQVGVKQSSGAERERGDDIEPDDVVVEDEKGSFWDLLFLSNIPRYVPDDRPLTKRSRLILASAYAQTVTRLDCLGYPIAGGTAAFSLYRGGQPVPGSKRFLMRGSSVGTSPIAKALRRRFPQKLSSSVKLPTGGPFTGKAFKLSETGSVGAAMGRLAPFVGILGLGWTLYEADSCLSQ